MKKILFSLICLLTCFSFVYAKTQIEYDWGRYITSRSFVASGKIDDEFAIISFDGDNSGYRYTLLDKNGDIKIEESTIIDGNYYILNNQLLVFYYDSIDRLCYQEIYDKNFELIKESHGFDCDMYNDMVYGVTDKYYYVGYYIFDKETNEPVDTLAYLENHELYDQFLEYNNANNYEKKYETLFNVFKEEFDNTPLVVESFIEMNYNLFYTNSSYIDKYFVGENGEFAILLRDIINNKYFIKLYDTDYNFIADIYLDSYNEPYVLFNDNYFYLSEVVEVDNNDSSNDLSYFNIVMNKFDLKGNKIETFDLVNVEDCKECFDDVYSVRNIFNIDSTRDGFYLLTEKLPQEKGSYDPIIKDEQVLEDIYPSVQKFTFIYDVDTKENDNGDIVVDKDNSKSGEKITYIVKPKEGYKLDKVIVTDENGNKIEIKDSSFTMPSSNVTIEAIFVVENPNTSVFIRIGIFGVIMLLTYYFVILQNIKVKKFE